MRSVLSVVLGGLLLAGCPAKDGGGDGGDDTGADSGADNGGSGGDSGENGGSNGDTGGPSGDFDSVSVRLSTGVATVVIVDWVVSGSPSEVWVEYGADASYGNVAPARLDNANRALVLGLTPNTTIHLRVAATVGGDTIYSDDTSITTGNGPTGLPDYDITTNRTGDAFGNFVMTSWFSAGSGDAAVLILNREGRPVWWTDAREQFLPSARPSRDGQAVWTISYTNVTDAGNSQICRHDLDGETTDCIATPYCHHDFVEMPDGRIACTQEILDTWRGYDLVGDVIVLFDWDGGKEVVWNAFDDVDIRYESYWDDHELTRGIDWSHANGLWYDEVDEDFYISFFYWEEIFKIPYRGRTTEWILGGDDSDFSIRGQVFGPQHAPQLIDGGILMFDNGSSATSRVTSYTLDTTRMQATNDLSYEHPEGRRAGVMGDANLLDNGYLASGWGDVGDIIVFDSRGSVVWRYDPPAGVASCQVYVYDDLYHLKVN